MRLLTAACGLLVLASTGCTQLPSSGPSTMAVVNSANNPMTLNYALVPVDERALDILARRPRDSFSGSFGGRQGGTSERIGVGDVISVTIWEAANGGLFSSANGAVGGGSKQTEIPEQPVASNGTILVPYAGAVAAEGRTPAEVKVSIEAALAGKAIEPQALVSVKRSVTNKVTVMGDAANGGLVPLSPRGTRVLDAIAAAGGTRAPSNEVIVQLVRGQTSAKVPMEKVVSSPEENVFLKADDVIALLHQPPRFTAFGATGKNMVVDFPVTGLTLDQAVANVGGLLDFRADPAGVFVFRYEREGTARELDPDSRNTPRDGRLPVVYQLNLRDPNGLFLAKRFEVADGDLVYVANASLTELEKFLLLIGSAAAPAVQVQRIVNNT